MSLFTEIQSLARFGVWEWDVAGGQLSWSDELHRLLEVPSGTPATFETWLARVHPDERSAVKGYFTRVRRDRGDHAIDYRIVRANGEVWTLQSRARTSVDDTGGVHALGIEQDVTENKELAARVVLSDRLASIGTLAGGAAHEINNPLATIAANLTLLADSYDTSLIEESQRGVERIRTVVRGLTAFSRGNDDTSEPLELRRVLEHALTLTSSEVRHRAQLVTRLDPLPWVHANGARLGQVFINLIVNAAESIADGRADEHEIQIAGRTDDAGWAIVEITDNGRGIAREIQPHIFDPFFTTKPVGQGTGLGLSITHGIVRSLGGDITFRTEVGKGTTFTVALPPSQPAQAKLVRVARGSSVPQRRSVLIVDDEVLYARSLRRVLANEHEVTVMTSGREALARLTSGERFDVILCDLMMPELTGAELHAAVATLDPSQAARMIFITGGAFSPASQRFLEQITNPRFEKPCDLAVLREAVRSIADTRD